MTQWGLDTLFNPAKRHMDDEKRRLQATREEAGDSSGGKRIDLTSGKVVIRADSTTDADATVAPIGADGTSGRTESGAEPDGPVQGRSTAAKKLGGKPAKGEPSAAAIRAAKRRGRTI